MNLATLHGFTPPPTQPDPRLGLRNIWALAPPPSPLQLPEWVPHAQSWLNLPGNPSFLLSHHPSLGRWEPCLGSCSPVQLRGARAWVLGAVTGAYG